MLPINKGWCVGFSLDSPIWWCHGNNNNNNSNNLSVKPVLIHSLVYVQLGQQQSECVDSLTVFITLSSWSSSFKSLEKFRTIWLPSWWSSAALKFTKDKKGCGCFGPGWVKLWAWLPAQQWGKRRNHSVSLMSPVWAPLSSASWGINWAQGKGHRDKTLPVCYLMAVRSGPNVFLTGRV